MIVIINTNNFKLIRSVLLKESTLYGIRCLSSTGCNLKKYKYALNKASQKNNTTGSSSSSGSKGSRPRNNFIYGDRTVTFFSLETEGEEEEKKRFFNPKQKVYSECVEDAVKDLLVSPEIDPELKKFPIEVVDVEVSESLATAYIIWRIPEEDLKNQNSSKDEVKNLLSKNLSHLRLLLPAFTNLTNPPNIHFVYDTVSERKAEFEKLLDSVRLEIEAFEHQRVAGNEASQS